MTQYERELESVKENNGDVEQFKKEWFKRQCATYRKYKGSEHDFRCGKVHID